MRGPPDPRPAPDDTPRERKRERFNARDWSDPLTCDHDGADLEALPPDPALPPHVVKLECPECGEWYDLDRETGELERDA